MKLPRVLLEDVRAQIEDARVRRPAPRTRQVDVAGILGEVNDDPIFFRPIYTDNSLVHHTV